MDATSTLPATLPTGDKREWGMAARALWRLMSNPNDTTQVFVIMRALNAGEGPRNYARLMTHPGGGRLAYRRVELAQRLMDRDFIASFAPGTVGAAYRDFLNRTGYSAQGLADISNLDGTEQLMEHPYAWFGRRVRDCHDLWHVLTGYEADEPLGEACLVAFSYAQTRGLGWAFIAAGAALQSIPQTRGLEVVRAILEGYRHGKRAAWLSGEDYETLLAEPLDAARARLNIPVPTRYLQAKRLAGEFLKPAATPELAAAE